MCNGPYGNPNLSAAFHHRKTIVLTKKKKCSSTSTYKNKIIYFSAWEINLPT